MLPPLAPPFGGGGGGLAGEMFVGTNTRAAAESSPFCIARDMSSASPGEPGTEEVMDGVRGVVVVVVAVVVGVVVGVVAVE